MTKDIIDSWRRRLVHEMRRQGLDMKNLSLKAGLGETYVRDTLDRRGGRVENIQKLAAALGVTFKWLMLGEMPKFDGQPVPARQPKRTLRRNSAPIVRVSARVAPGSSLDDENVQIEITGITMSDPKRGVVRVRELA